MSGRTINFDEKKILKSDFYENKKVINLDIDINKIFVSKKEPYGTKNQFKHFIGYNYNDIIRPLFVRLPKMTGYAREFDEIATMSLRLTINSFLKIIIKHGKKLKGQRRQILKVNLSMVMMTNT